MLFFIKKNFKEILSGVLLINRVIYLTIKYYTTILKKNDSFYSESLRLFYVRIFEIIQKKSFYPINLGKLNKLGFIFHNFLAIKICYLIMSRKYFILFSNLVFIFLIFYLFNNQDAWIIFIVFIFSLVTYANQSQSANYQYFGIVTSVFATYFYFLTGYSLEFITFFILSIIFSLSGFILSTFSIAIYLLFNQQLLELLLILVSSFLLFLIFLINNYIFLKQFESEVKISKLINIVAKILYAIGAHRHVAKNNNILKREINISRSIFACLPFALIIFYNLFFSKYEFIFVYFFLTILFFFNQSKLFRLFDYHLIYSWIFLLTLLLIDKTSFYWIFLIILVGTNPIVNYGFTKKFGILKYPIFLTPIERQLILDTIKKKIPKKSFFILPMNYTKKYNDIFRYEHLLLEWIWSAASKINVKYFPDWHSLFLTPQGINMFQGLPSKKVKNNLFILQIKKFHEKKFEKLKISELFPKKIIEAYFKKL